MEQDLVSDYFKILKATYSEEELCSTKGYGKLRYEIFSPLFTSLYQNKVVYKEKYTCIITIENIKITPVNFEAIANTLILIPGSKSFDKYFEVGHKWSFGANWSNIRLIGTHLASYIPWMIWCDPHTVKKIENLALNNRMEEAADILYEDTLN